MAYRSHRVCGFGATALALTTLVTTGIAGCSGRHLPMSPAYPHMDDGFLDGGQVTRPGLPGDEPQALHIQPADTLSVEVVSTATQVYGGVLVDATGTIHLPLVGDVPVGGMTLSEAEQAILARWRKFDRLVQIHVQMGGFQGQRVSVLGAVGAPGTVQLTPGARLADVLALAGGPILVTGQRTLPADLSEAVIKREGQALPVDFERALQGDPAHNVFVQPADMIYVPPGRGRTIAVLGQVGNTVLAYHEGLRLTEALALAGGVAPGGDRYDIRVIRGTLTRPRIYRASLAEFVRGETHDVMLRPGDIIYVSQNWIQDINDVMGIISPLIATSLTVTTAAAVSTRR